MGPRGPASASARVGRVTLFLSLLTIVIPLAVVAAWILAGLASATQDLSEVLAALVIVAVVACYFIDRAAQRLRARNLKEAKRRDPNWMLYLRNFGDDAQKILTSRFNRNGLWQRSTGWLNPIGSRALKRCWRGPWPIAGQSSRSLSVAGKCALSSGPLPLPWARPRPA